MTPTQRQGIFFTAKELASELENEFGWVCSFLPTQRKSSDGYDVSELDCLMVLLDNYDLSKIHSVSGTLIKIAWLRNWFDRWVARPRFRKYDLCLCSSEKACEFVEKSAGKPPYLLKIATNAKRFNSARYSADTYPGDDCFTGSYWGYPREIEQFEPKTLPYNFALYGSGWGNHPQFESSYKGSFPCVELPAVYAGTKIIIDDANHVNARGQAGGGLRS